MRDLHGLTNLPPFQDLSADGKRLLANGLLRTDCARSSVILHKGQSVSGAYVVLSGRLRVFTLAPNGTEATLYFIDPGETCVLALNCLFNDLLYPAWVQAETATTIAIIPGSLYRTLFEREPGIQDMTVRTLSTLVFRLMSELEQLHSSHHRERLANFILNHASSDGSLHLTQQQLAQHLGTTREVIARLLRTFVCEGLVRTQRGAVIIRDLPRLRAVVSIDQHPPGNRPRRQR
ncbi:MAG: Crp/Fnr family transcriptional regulator [Ectothiorhodospiraceae bacterium]|jgi:CRP/FNR family transcriptional regulator|nr:Crp/Fnr family transcriptional regulator [Ectothiorhodospiraceae bacterium]